MANKVNKFIQKGTSFLNDAPSQARGSWFSIGDGERKIVVPLINIEKELISINRIENWDFQPPIFFPYLGEDCPSHDLGWDKKIYYGRSFMPVLVPADEENPIQIWAMGKMIANQIKAANEAMIKEADKADGVKGVKVAVSRTGKTKNDTSYSVAPIGVQVDVEPYQNQIPDIVSLIGPFTREEVLEMLEGRGVDVERIMNANASMDEWDEEVEEISLDKVVPF